MLAKNRINRNKLDNNAKFDNKNLDFMPFIQNNINGHIENNIPFYVKQGFDKYLKTVKNFFLDNYDEELFDGDLKCSDMYYYEKKLKNI